jgi:hypothetical protein
VRDKKTLAVISLLLAGALAIWGLVIWQRSVGTGSNSTSNSTGADVPNVSGTVNVDLANQASIDTPEAIGVMLAKDLLPKSRSTRKIEYLTCNVEPPWRADFNLQDHLQSAGAHFPKKFSGTDGSSYRGRVFQNVDDTIIRGMAVNEASSPSR